MSTRYVRTHSIAATVFLTLCACASNFAVYESPSSGRLSEITIVNAAESQKASLATFDDGRACTRKRHIQFDNKDGLAAGTVRSLVVAAGKEFALFASLDAIETDEYGVELGMTSGGPAPVRRRTVMAIGCSAKLSFEVEPDKSYHIVISEPVSSRRCSVMVSEIGDEGRLVAIDSTRRAARPARDELGSFCEPLVH